MAREEAEHIGGAALAIHERLLVGGKIIVFGNGGSATDANDFAIDCVLPPPGYHLFLQSHSLLSPPTSPPSPMMLAPSHFSAPVDRAGAPRRRCDRISTSGGSRNIIMALEEARKRNMLTVALLGYDGGEIKRKADRRFSLGRELRLYSPHSGSPGFDLPCDARIPGGAKRIPVARLELYGSARCPHTSEMRDWLEWKRSEFVEYDVETDPAARGRMRRLRAASAPCPSWSRMARSSRWAGKATVASSKGGVKRARTAFNQWLAPLHSGSRRSAGGWVSSVCLSPGLRQHA